MLKKILGLLICISVISLFSTASAHDSFTWFGLKKNDTEVVIKSSNHHSIDCKHKKCPICDKKHKHKPKPPKSHKHKDHKKWHHHLKWWD